MTHPGPSVPLWAAATCWWGCILIRPRSPSWTPRSSSVSRSRWFRAACSPSCSPNDGPRMATRFARTSNSSTTSSPNTRTFGLLISRSRAGTGWCTGCDWRLLHEYTVRWLDQVCVLLFSPHCPGRPRTRTRVDRRGGGRRRLRLFATRAPLQTFVSALQPRAGPWPCWACPPP